MKHLICIDPNDTEENRNAIIKRINSVFPDKVALNEHTFIVVTDKWSAKDVAKKLEIPVGKKMLFKDRPQITHLVLTLSGERGGWWYKHVWEFLDK